MGKRVTAGGVVFDSTAFPTWVYIAHPSGNFGPWTFPKGGVEPGESLEEAAVREVREETGVPARILGYLGCFTDHQINHFFVMVRSGPVGQHDWEMDEVRRVRLDDALDILSADGNMRDVEVIRGVLKWL